MRKVHRRKEWAKIEKKRERNEEKGGKRGEKMPIRTIRKNILTVYCLGGGKGEFRR